MAEVLANTWRGDFQYIALSCVIWNLSEMGPIVTQHYFFWHKNRERKSITFQYKALRSQLSILACAICTVLGLENLQWSFWLIQLIYVFQFRASELDITPVGMDWQHMVPFGVSQCNLICFAFTRLVRVQKLLVMFRKRLWFGFTSFTKVSLLFPHTMQQVGNEYN